MRMHNPPHPGEVLRTLCIQPLGLTITEAARALDVSRKTLSEIRRPSVDRVARQEVTDRARGISG